MLTIAYFTSRKEAMLEWFLDSLHRETGGNYDGIRVIIVDFWAQCTDGWTEADIMARKERYRPHVRMPLQEIFWVPPKPNVWQGEYRRTKENWWAASNARNTALCLAPPGWIAFVDDLSVLAPGWLGEVRACMAGDPMIVTAGAYRKVKDLVVEDGVIKSFTDYPPGRDGRWQDERTGPVDCGGNWLFGCSLVADVEAFLAINGWPETCDGLSFEDVIAGIMLTKKGYRLQYRQAMYTLESEERHHAGPVMRREDYGKSPKDKSHAILAHAQNGDGWAVNYFDADGIRGLRQRILSGEPFPIVRIPEHEWYSGTRLEELK